MDTSNFLLKQKTMRKKSAIKSKSSLYSEKVNKSKVSNTKLKKLGNHNSYKYNKELEDDETENENSSQLKANEKNDLYSLKIKTKELNSRRFREGSKNYNI